MKDEAAKSQEVVIFLVFSLSRSSHSIVLGKNSSSMQVREQRH